MALAVKADDLLQFALPWGSLQAHSYAFGYIKSHRVIWKPVPWLSYDNNAEPYEQQACDQLLGTHADSRGRAETSQNTG